MSEFIPLTIRRESAVIHLTRGKVSIVDTEDWPALAAFKWCAVGPMKSGKFYACRRHDSRFVYMHRVLVPNAKYVDHWRGGGLDNRRENLRACNQRQNGANRGTPKHNSSGYKGVTWHKPSRRWAAYIHVDNRKNHLGMFDSPSDAARAYDTAAKDAFGEFAVPNLTAEKEVAA